MTDTGPTSPIRPNILIDTQRSEPQDARPSLLILKLPPELSRTEEAIQIDGKVVNAAPDGTIVIRTDKGDITAKAEKPVQLMPQANVEIRLPKGDPPANLTIRPAPQTPEPNPVPNTPVQPDIKLPETITISELVKKIETLTLKPLTPQQINKIVVPYLLQIPAKLQPTSSPSFIPLNIQISTPAINLAQAVADNDPLQPATLLKMAQNSYDIPKLSLQQIDNPDSEILISPAQGLLDLLKNQNADLWERGKLITPPLSVASDTKKISIQNSPQTAAEAALALINNFSTGKTETLSIALGQSTSEPKTPSNLPPLQFKIISITSPQIQLSDATSAMPILENMQLHPAPESIMPAKEVAVQTVDTSDTLKNLIYTPANQSPDLQTLSAEVIGYTPEKNYPILEFIIPDHAISENASPTFQTQRLYALEAPIKDIPIGTRIELLPIPQLQIAQTPSIIPAHSLISSSLFQILSPQIWSSLQDIHTTLSQASPQIAQSFANILPQANVPQNLGATALFFLAAVRSGNIDNWLGDKITDVLRKAGKSDLINRLNSEVSSLLRLSSDPVSQEWRTTAMPMMWQNEVHKMIVHYKRDEQSNEQREKKNTGGVRFVMNLSLSNIGPLQLDGLFRSDQKRLDLILRTNTPFISPMQNEMKLLYTHALEDIAYSGELSFQNKTEQWVNITPDKQFGSFSKKI